MYLEPRVGFFDQDLPIPFGPLFGVCGDEHGNVNLPHLPFLVKGDLTPLGNDGLVDQQRGAGIRFHGREEGADDLEAVLIAPVVQALPQDPAVAVFARGLGREEVVTLVRDAFEEAGGVFACGFGEHDFVKILYDEMPGGELLGEPFNHYIQGYGVLKGADLR